jgi:hypothetical protein
MNVAKSKPFDKTSARARVFSVIARKPGISSEIVHTYLEGVTDKAARNAIGALSHAGYIERRGDRSGFGQWYAVSDPYGVTDGLPLREASQQPAPAQFVHDFSQPYRPGDWRKAVPLRPGALDHEKCPSLRAEGRVPYAGVILHPVGGKRK